MPMLTAASMCKQIFRGKTISSKKGNLDPRALFPSDRAGAQSVCEGKKPWERGW